MHNLLHVFIQKKIFISGLFSLLFAVFNKKFTIQTNFSTVYSVALADLILPTGRRYTFMYLYKIFIKMLPYVKSS